MISTMKTTYKLLGLTVFLLVCTLQATGQPPAPPATPIDGGLGVLLAMGSAYGIKKLAEKRKQS